MSRKLDRLDRFISLLGGALNWVTMAGLIVMSLITVIDVVGAKLFRAPLLWSYSSAQNSRSNFS